MPDTNVNPNPQPAQPDWNAILNMFAQQLQPQAQAQVAVPQVANYQAQMVQALQGLNQRFDGLERRLDARALYLAGRASHLPDAFVTGGTADACTIVGTVGGGCGLFLLGKHLGWF
jgi:hypothetical protein